MITDVTSAILSADRYDQPKAREYQELMDIIARRGQHGEEVYGNLMNVENRVLDTVDRVVNDARLQTSTRNSFLNMSMLEIAAKTAFVLRDTYRDLFRVSSVRDFKNVFTKQNRPMYLGIILVLLALMLMVVDASSA
jgi:hypothetical protein